MAFTVYNVPPIAPDPDNTTYIEGGGLRVGVEYRLLNDEELAANYEGAAMDEVQAGIQGDIEDSGVSLHVESVVDGKEYLRFDCFENGPHYHYIEPTGKSQTVVDYDSAALGEMLPWALGQLRERLFPMLKRAGGAALIAGIDEPAFRSCLDEVERLARDASEALATQKQH